MKKKVYIVGTAFTVLSAFGAALVLAISLFAIPILPDIIRVERYLVDSTSALARTMYPDWYNVRVVGGVILMFVGMGSCVILYVRMLKNLWSVLPRYSEAKQEYLRLCLSMLAGTFIFGSFLAGELIIRYQTNKMYGSHFSVGVRLSPPETWNQKDTADERGMNYMKHDWYAGDTFRFVNNQGFFARWNYDKETIDSFKRLGYKIVFIIGDSYTEGVTTGTFDHTFCELAKKELLPRKILLCPFGIGGTDVIQYRLVAEKFVPELRPDMVIIGFCGGNDFISWDRIPTPGVPLCYQTNVGYLNSNVGYNAVLCPTRDSLYRYYKKFAPGTSSLRLVRYLRASFDGIPEPEYPFPSSDTSTATWRNLAKVRALSDSVGAKFFIAFAPDINISSLRSQKEADSLYAKNFGDLQKDAKYYLKGDIRYEDYMTPTTTPHFNDAGNRKFATFLEEEIMKNIAQ